MIAIKWAIQLLFCIRWVHCVSWTELIALPRLESLSFFCQEEYQSLALNDAVSDIEDLEDHIPLQITVSELSIYNDYSQILRFVYGTMEDRDLMWSNTKWTEEALSVSSELKALGTIRDGFLHISKWPDTSLMDGLMVVQLSKAAHIASETLRKFCNSSHSEIISIDYLMQIALNISISDPMEVVEQQLLYDYLNRSLIPLLIQPHACMSYINVPPPRILTKWNSTIGAFNDSISDSIIKITDKIIIANNRHYFHKYNSNSIIVLRSIFIILKDPPAGARELPFSQIRMSCPIISSCIPFRDFVLAPYNALILTSALAMSTVITRHDTLPIPNIDTNDNPLDRGFEDSLQFHPLCSSPARMLSLGLGGGEVHGFVLHHFPCIGVDSVEVEPVVIDAARDYFGLKACGGRDGVLPEPDVYPSKPPEECMVGDAVCTTESKTLNVNVTDTVDVCRSRVYIYDAREFVRDAADKGGLQWEFVVVDLYDAGVTLWDGNAGEGHSNPILSDDTVRSFIRSLRDITEPLTGLTIVHLHMDKTYVKYLEAIQNQFVDTRELFINGNSRIIVASRYPGLHIQGSSPSSYDSVSRSISTTFPTMPLDDPNWMCLDPYGHAEAVQSFGRRHGYTERMSTHARFASRGIYW
eukprot:gene5962-12033_t